jgi:protein required for attachment to host cells
MPKRSNLMIVLADGEHARFVRRGADGVLRTEQKFDSVAAHKRSADLGTDAPGASFHSDSTAHHAFTPRNDLHEQEKAHFAQLVAQKLNGMAGDGTFDALLIVALPGTAAGIASALSGAVRTALLGTVNKNLVKTADDQLVTHLGPWIPAPGPGFRRSVTLGEGPNT